MFELNHEQVLRYLPDRKPESHKGDYGKILLLCGSRGYTGAAFFAAMGALRCGAGLVFLGVPESIYAISACKLNEPIVFPLPDSNGMLSSESTAQIISRLPQMDAVLIGCGLGQSEGTLDVVRAVLEHAVCPVVLDADGINLISGHKDILRERMYPTVITPHMGEFIRMGGGPHEDRVISASKMASDLNCTVLLKGNRTIITDGVTTWRNTTGNAGMAVGGSGDLLAGMIAGLLGQGLTPNTAAACAAWLHGAAGDICATHLGQYAMLPSDMLDALPRLLK